MHHLARLLFASLLVLGATHARPHQAAPLHGAPHQALRGLEPYRSPVHDSSIARSFGDLGRRGSGDDPDAVTVLQTIAPASTSCTATGGAALTFPDECATAAEAAPRLIAAFQTYDVTSAWEISCVLALMAFETAEFRYHKNHFPAPGRPGQGTRNMQMPNFNVDYARSRPELAPQVQQITAGVDAQALSADQLNAVRALVLDPQYDWASGAWFLVNKCSAGARAIIQAGAKDAAWQAYLGCVGVTASDERTVYFTRALSAFGLA